MNPVILGAIVGAIGLVIGTLISTAFTAIIDWRRRVSESRQFALEAALRLTKMKDEQFSETVKLLQKSGKSFKVHTNDPFINLLWYHKHLIQIMQGKLSNIEKKYAGQLEKIDEKWDKEQSTV